MKTTTKSERQAAGTKTYIIHADGYMRTPSMRQFRGSFHGLLVNVITANGYGFDDDEHPEALSADVLRKRFDGLNGDGCDDVMVWCVEDGRQVLGSLPIVKPTRKARVARAHRVLARLAR